MQKTRLGISVGMLGAAIYLTGLLSGSTCHDKCKNDDLKAGGNIL